MKYSFRSTPNFDSPMLGED